MKVIGLTGNDGGKLAARCDVEIRVAHDGYATAFRRCTSR
jgi:D-sedoheptulose 7-phosphate isomerase